MISLFSIAYLPSISYVGIILKSKKIILEKHEHYIKQTYRNRSLIYSPNGVHPLIIPVAHDDLYKKPIHEIKISYETDWQKIHWRTIASSYRNSPYFEFFEEELNPFYEAKTETLFEFNLSLLKRIFSLMQISFEIEFTSTYEKKYSKEIIDLRNIFYPDQRNLNVPLYNQVFSERHGFISDLSILDLMFNKGPQAMEYLLSI